MLPASPLGASHIRTRTRKGTPGTRSARFGAAARAEPSPPQRVQLPVERLWSPKRDLGSKCVSEEEREKRSAGSGADVFPFEFMDFAWKYLK